jgi:protein TonB
VWISLGLHAALIALVQIAPPPAVNLGEPLIEARLVPAHTAQPDAEHPPAPVADAPEKLPDISLQPLLAPSGKVDALPVSEPLAPPAPPAAASVAEPEPVAEPRAGESAAQPNSPSAPAAAPAPAAALTSAVDLTYYSARDLDVQPRALREIVPGYPDDADRQRLSGTVRLRLKLEADGRISDIEVVSSTPPGVFEESAIKAFRDARFAPAQKNGRPVRARVVIEVLYDWEGRTRAQ